MSTTTAALLGLAAALVVMALVLFGAAGTFDYPEAWAFLALFGASSLALTLYLARKDPALLARRVRAGPFAEEDPRQKAIQALAQLCFLGFVLVPALDRRFSWSHVPAAVVVVGHVLVALGLSIVFLVYRANTFASAVIEVVPGQHVVDTGPYAVVRHPMYAGALLFLAGMPLALGSWWGLALLVPMTLTLVLRVLVEESTLRARLAGYTDYCARTRYRLMPGVW